MVKKNKNLDFNVQVLFLCSKIDMGFPYALSQKCELWHFSLPASILPRFVAVYATLLIALRIFV